MIMVFIKRFYGKQWSELDRKEQLPHYSNSGAIAVRRLRYKLSDRKQVMVYASCTCFDIPRPCYFFIELFMACVDGDGLQVLKGWTSC